MRLCPPLQLCFFPDAAEFLRFLVAGAAGFAIDSTLALAFVHGLGWPPLPARLLSFAFAFVATWLINRFWTFRVAAQDKPARGIGAEFLGYAAVQATGGAANFVVYAAVVALTGQSPLELMIAIAAGSAAGVGLNYFGARKFVFGSKA